MPDDERPYYGEAHKKYGMEAIDKIRSLLPELHVSDRSALQATIEQAFRRCTGYAAIDALKAEPAAQAGVRYMPQAELDAEQAELEKLSQDVLAGNSKAIDKLRAKLDQCPHIWRRLADLQKLVEERMAEQIAAKDPLMLEAFRKRASELRHALQGDTSCTLEAVSKPSHDDAEAGELNESVK